MNVPAGCEYWVAANATAGMPRKAPCPWAATTTVYGPRGPIKMCGRCANMAVARGEATRYPAADGGTGSCS